MLIEGPPRRVQSRPCPLPRGWRRQSPARASAFRLADRLDTTALPAPPPLARASARDIEPIANDRNQASPGQLVLLVVEDDPHDARILDRLHRSDEDLVGRTAILVDDDARNIFALSSVLERRGMRVRTATTGSEAVAVLEA